VIVCVIPALNAERTIRSVVTQVQTSLDTPLVIVVDDGSTDRTGAEALEAGAQVVSLGRNRGKGVALRAGFDAALAGGASVVLTLDADGQHDPAAAPALVGAVRDGADVAVGTRRRLGTAMPWHRRMTNTLSSLAVSVCAGRRMVDVQSGYRAIRAPVLRAIAPLGDRYEYETDFLIQTARAGFSIAWVPVPTLYSGSPSHFRGVRDTALVIGTICLAITLHQRRRISGARA
jgi:glycosyltransferase involved in cell wall biosynthesis